MKNDRRELLMTLPPGAIWIAPPTGQRCSWCGHQEREGDEHAKHVNREDGGIDIVCRVRHIVVYPKNVGRIEGITT